MSKPQLRWTNQGAASDFEAARKYLSLIASDAKVSALVKNLRKTKIVDHAAKDLLRAAELPLLPRDDPHVDEDLKRIQQGKAAGANSCCSRRLRPRTPARRGGRLSPDLRGLLFRRERARSLPHRKRGAVIGSLRPG